jgi:PKHD-type hydroxylase
MIYPIPPRQSKGKDFTAYWEGFLTAEEINKILAMPEWSKASDASIGGAGGPSEVNKNVRTTDVGWVWLNQDNAWLWERLANVIAEVNSQFFKFDLTGCYEAIQLGVYKESDKGHYNWHIDAAPTDKHAPRKLSMSLLLSDPSEFEGGELQIKTCNDEIQTLGMIKGRAWFFPSYMLHRVTPVTKGVRRSLVLWVGGPEFK